MSTTKSKNTVWYINCAIVFLCFIGIPQLPTFGQVTESGMAVLGVFVGMLYGWLTVGFIWPSIIGLVFLGFSNVMTLSDALTAGWGNIYAVILVILGFMLGGYVQSSNLADAISSFLLTRKFLIGKPWTLVVLLFILSWVLSVFAGVFITIFCCWAILYSMLERCGYQKRSIESGYFLALVVFGAVAGMIFLPFQSTSLLYVNFMTAAVGATIDYLAYMIFQIVVSLGLAISYAAFGKFILKIDLSAIANAGDQFAYLKGVKLTFEQKFCLAMVVLMLVIVLLPSFLPAESAFCIMLNKIGVAGAIIIALTIPAIVRDKDGKALIDLAECTKNCSWDIIWLLVATMPVASAMQSADTGIIATVVGFVMNLVGDMNWVVFTILCSIVLGLVTQVTHNLILAIVLFGPLCQVCVNLGGNPVVWFMVNYWLNMCAFATPAASANSAVLHGNTDWVRPKDAYILGFGYLAINLVIVNLIAFTVGQILF